MNHPIFFIDTDPDDEDADSLEDEDSFEGEDEEEYMDMWGEEDDFDEDEEEEEEEEDEEDDGNSLPDSQLSGQGRRELYTNALRLREPTETSSSVLAMHLAIRRGTFSLEQCSRCLQPCNGFEPAHASVSDPSHNYDTALDVAIACQSLSTLEALEQYVYRDRGSRQQTTGAAASSAASAAAVSGTSASNEFKADGACDMETLDEAETKGPSRRYAMWGGWAASLASCDDFEKLRAEQPDVHVLFCKLDKVAEMKLETINAVFSACAFTKAEVNKLNSPLLDGLLFAVTLRAPESFRDLATGNDIEIPPATSVSPVALLMRVIRSSSQFVETVRFLLDLNSDLVTKSDQWIWPPRQRPLAIACLRGHDQIVDLLIQRGFLLESNEPYITVQHVARLGWGKILRLLTPQVLAAKRSKSAEWDAEWDSGLDFAIRLAVRYGRVQIIRQLVSDLSYPLSRQPGALHFACRYRQIESLVALIELGVAVNSASSVALSLGEWISNRTPLQTAIREGFQEGVRVLLHHGADPAKTCADGTLPLVLAVREMSSVPIVRMLLWQGIDGTVPSDEVWARPEAEWRSLVVPRAGGLVNRPDRSSRAPLHWASVSFSAQAASVIRVLLDAGADIDARDSDGCTPLLLAASSGPEATCLQLIRAGASVNAVTNTGLSALSWALQNSRSTLVLLKALLDKGADCNPKKPSRAGGGGVMPVTPLLHIAANSLPAFQLLLQAGADPNSVDGLGQTPLHKAAALDNIRMAQMLLKHGADADRLDFNRSTPLHFSDPRNALMTELLLAHTSPVNLNVVNTGGYTPLLVAMDRCELKLARRFIAKGADPTLCPKNRRAVVLRLAGKGCIDFIGTLLGCGVSIDWRDEHLNTFLHYAVEASDEAMVQFLLRKGADPNIVDRYGNLLLTRSFNPRVGYCSVLPTLLANGADPNAVDVNGSPALCYAIRNGSFGSINALLAAGADLEGKDARFRTPLVLAVEARSAAAVKLLIAAGADINVVDSDQRTLLCLAVRLQDFPTVQVLLNAGADVNAPSGPQLNTPLHEAALVEDIITVRRLLDLSADPTIRNARGLTPIQSVTSYSHFGVDFKALVQQQQANAAARVARLALDAQQQPAARSAPVLKPVAQTAQVRV